jgi:tetratricopeptide (TPR) repeat protein
MCRTIASALLALGMAACAARGPSLQLTAEMAKADALFSAGCYRCLEEALTIYERVAAAPRAPRDVSKRAFDTTVLLSLRAKELGIVPNEWTKRARDLSARVAPSPQSLPPAAYLAAADLVSGDVSGIDPAVRPVVGRRRPAGESAAPLPERAALEPFLATDLLAQYLAIAVDCEDPFARKGVSEQAVLSRYPSSPAIHFRLASCGMAPQLLEPLRKNDGRWADTLFTEGRRHISRRPIGDVPEAARSFAGAHAAFPGSDAITMALANAENALSEFDAALGHFDAVLARHPTHRDALIGRVQSLSYLNRHADAVSSASRLIELDTWHIGDAYYWRAWNRFHLKALDEAWDDVERATKLLVNTSVYTLAGFIAYTRQQLEVAVNRFDRAYAMDKTNCEAVWNAALVHVDLRQWPPAAPKFATAMSCFVASAAAARKEIATLQATTYDEAFKQRRIAVQQKIIDTSEHRAAQAAFNAAQSHVQLGEKNPALNFADAAAEHPLMRDKALALKATIEKMP